MGSFAALPRRLQCTEVVSSEFAGALKLVMFGVPSARRHLRNSFADGHTVAQHKGLHFKSPRACAELYWEWVEQRIGPDDVRRPGQGSLSHLRLDTVARLAVDVFLDELAVWQAKWVAPVVRHGYQALPECTAELIRLGFREVNGKRAGSLFLLTEAEAEAVSHLLILPGPAWF